MNLIIFIDFLIFFLVFLTVFHTTYNTLLFLLFAIFLELVIAVILSFKVQNYINFFEVFVFAFSSLILFIMIYLIHFYFRFIQVYYKTTYFIVKGFFFELQVLHILISGFSDCFLGFFYHFNNNQVFVIS